jgi:hypothetical protein
MFQFSTESEASRRQETRRIKQARQFWRGLQYMRRSERDQNWHLPFEQKLVNNSSVEDKWRHEFVTNVYQAFGLSLISVLSQDVPRVRFSRRPRRPPPKSRARSSALIASAT